VSQREKRLFKRLGRVCGRAGVRRAGGRAGSARAMVWWCGGAMGAAVRGPWKSLDHWPLALDP
jgi:hypothetical protein